MCAPYVCITCWFSFPCPCLQYRAFTHPAWDVLLNQYLKLFLKINEKHDAAHTHTHTQCVWCETGPRPFYIGSRSVLGSAAILFLFNTHTHIHTQTHNFLCWLMPQTTWASITCQIQAHSSTKIQVQGSVVVIVCVVFWHVVHNTTINLLWEP